MARVFKQNTTSLLHLLGRASTITSSIDKYAQRNKGSWHAERKAGKIIRTIRQLNIATQNYKRCAGNAKLVVPETSLGYKFAPCNNWICHVRGEPGKSDVTACERM